MKMRILNFLFKKFESAPTEIKIIETWCVKWSSLHKDILGKGAPQINVQGFPTKDSADAYAEELRSARALLGDKGFGVDVYLQRTPTNL